MPPNADKPKKPRKPRKKVVAPSRTFASKIGNGSADFLAPSGAIDGRSLPARRFRELTLNLTSDMGGLDQLSEVQRQLAKRFAGCAVVCEMQEAAIVKGEKVDLAQYATLLNAQNRLASTIGVRRAVIDLTPSLEQYIAAKRAEKARRPPEPDDDDADDDGSEK